MRFDFYLPNQNICIEYDGEHHFIANGGYFTEDFVKGVQYRDKIKNNYCKEKQIQLIRIPHTDFTKLDFNYLKERGVNGE